MVDRYLTCQRTGCGGVAIAQGADLRSRFIKYKCEKCGHTFQLERKNVEIAKQLLHLGDPHDKFRSGVL
jgi:hypothetical protein